MDKKLPTILSIVAAVLLVIAIGNYPYGYYQFLRWIVCFISLFIAYTAYQSQKLWLSWLFIPIAIIFNPFLPLTFDDSIWRVLDIFCGLFFSVNAAFLSYSEVKSKPGKLNRQMLLFVILLIILFGIGIVCYPQYSQPPFPHLEKHTTYLKLAISF